MKVRLIEIAPHKAGLMFGALMATLSLLFWPFILIAEIAQKAQPNSNGFSGIVHALFLILPLFYGIFGYIMTVVMCIIHNFYAKKIGGIGLTFELPIQSSEQSENHSA